MNTEQESPSNEQDNDKDRCLDSNEQDCELQLPRVSHLFMNLRTCKLFIKLFVNLLTS